MQELTVVGGGIGGLTAAITAAEQGMNVRLIEARPTLGGRARTADGPFRANWGPHVVYSDGPLWRWLDGRGLARPAGSPPLTGKLLFRVDGRGHRLPPRGMVRALWRLRRRTAPTDRPFFDWASTIVGDAHARRLATFTGVATFDHDPGRLSAAFVNERLRRTTSVPPAARYMPGGWMTLIDRLAARAGDLGVHIETGAAIDRLPERPVILAVPLATARSLTGDATLRAVGTRTALLDVAIERARGMAFIVSDLDAPGWVEAFSMADPSLAPTGHHLVQGQVGLRPDETLEQGVTRIEELIDVGYPGWRTREVWRRRARVEDQSGALDLPGCTWRDRPAIDRGDGVFVVGDMVATPGLLSEVSHESALRAVAALTSEGTARLWRRATADRASDAAKTAAELHI